MMVYGATISCPKEAKQALVFEADMQALLETEEEARRLSDGY